MNKDEIKPHWQRIIKLSSIFKNADFKVVIQNGLPVLVEVHELKQKEFDLTKDIDEC